MNNTNAQDRTFSINRTFNAPRERVFAAFSQCEHLKHWWSPAGWHLSVCEMDFREGGSWLYCMSGPGPDGQPMDSYGKASYQEITAPEKIIYTDSFVDKDGSPLENMPSMQITVTFEDVKGKTRVTTETIFGSKEELDAVIGMGMEEGLKQTWDKLEAYLSQ
ncbi:MAG: SRPBCC domain-containing protein [Trueperaceae bacterium]|nr:SRPBCC domain-containing protein [Trueperaceae bacterium]